MITTKVDRSGHSAVAAIRKHAKFVARETGYDYLTALEETTDAYRECRDTALAKVGQKVCVLQSGSTLVTVVQTLGEDEWWVTFSLVSSSYEGVPLQ